jgi:23S rRNA pseudouridine1911/1915/1917 synthase
VQRQSVKAPRLMLHAWKLEFTHPITGTAMQFEAKVPEAFAPWMAKINEK